MQLAMLMFVSLSVTAMQEEKESHEERRIRIYEERKKVMTAVWRVGRTAKVIDIISRPDGGQIKPDSVVTLVNTTGLPDEVEVDYISTIRRKNRKKFTKGGKAQFIKTREFNGESIIGLLEGDLVTIVDVSDDNVVFHNDLVENCNNHQYKISKDEAKEYLKPLFRMTVSCKDLELEQLTNKKTRSVSAPLHSGFLTVKKAKTIKQLNKGNGKVCDVKFFWKESMLRITYENANEKTSKFYVFTKDTKITVSAQCSKGKEAGLAHKGIEYIKIQNIKRKSKKFHQKRHTTIVLTKPTEAETKGGFKGLDRSIPAEIAIADAFQKFKECVVFMILQVSFFENVINPKNTKTKSGLFNLALLKAADRRPFLILPAQHRAEDTMFKREGQKQLKQGYQFLKKNILSRNATEVDSTNNQKPIEVGELTVSVEPANRVATDFRRAGMDHDEQKEI